MAYDLSNAYIIINNYQIINLLTNKKFKKYKIDGYVVPKNDEFFSEYAANDRLKTISNFSGSAGLAIIKSLPDQLVVGKSLFAVAVPLSVA